MVEKLPLKCIKSIQFSILSTLHFDSYLIFMQQSVAYIQLSDYVCFGFLGGTGPSPSHPLWRTVPTSLPRSQPSLVILLMQDKTEREFFMQRLRTPFAGSDSTPPGLSRTRSSPARHLWLGTTSSIFDLWSRPWGVAGLLVSVKFLHVLIPWKGSGSTTTTTTTYTCNQGFLPPTVPSQNHKSPTKS